MLRLAARRAAYDPPCSSIILACRSASALASTSAVPTSTPPYKYPTRGGQNLSERFQRLEKSVRGKEAYQRDIHEIAGERAANASVSGRRARPSVDTFMGFVVPEEPKPPGPDECCMSGCAICVQDLYVEALDEYKKAVDSLRSSLTSLNVPEHRWPHSIRASDGAQSEQKKNVAYDAFAELERQLEKKREAASQSGAPSLSLTTQGSRRRKKSTLDPGLLYEGLRWVIFSNR